MKVPINTFSCSWPLPVAQNGVLAIVGCAIGVDHTFSFCIVLSFLLVFAWKLAFFIVLPLFLAVARRLFVVLLFVFSPKGVLFLVAKFAIV